MQSHPSSGCSLDDKPGLAGAAVSWSRNVLHHDNEVLNLPLNPRYIDKIAATGAQIRVCSRWFNAISVSADQETALRVENLPFVRGLEPVPKARRVQYESGIAAAAFSKPTQDEYGRVSCPARADRGGGVAQRGLSGAGESASRYWIMDSITPNIRHSSR